MSNNVNLLEPNKNQNTIVPLKKLQMLRITAASLLFIVSVWSVIMFILIALSPLPALQKQEHSLRLTLSESQTDMGKLALINERTTSINDVISTRKSLSQTVAYIQGKVTGDMNIVNMEIDKSMVSLTVESKSLQSLDTFLSGLIQMVQNKQGFSQITLNDLTIDKNSDAYSLTIHMVRL